MNLNCRGGRMGTYALVDLAGIGLSRTLGLEGKKKDA